MVRARIAVPDSPDAEGERIVVNPGLPDAGDLDALINADDNWRWTIYRLLTQAERQQFSGQARAMVGRHQGAVDLDLIRREYGGGTFEFWGKVSGDDNLRCKVVVALAGQVRSLLTPEAPPASATAPAPSAPAVNGTSPELVRILERISDRLDALSHQAPPAPAPQPLADLINGLAALDQLRGERGQSGGAESVKAYFDAVQKGIELGQEREPSSEPGGIDWGKVIESGMAVFERIAQVRSTRRAAPRSSGSSARVVEDPPPPPAAPTAPTPEPAAAAPAADEAERSRWVTAVDSLARAIEIGDEPADFAATLERILPDNELAILTMSSPADVMAQLQSFAAGRYPVLADPRASAYVAQVLQVLRSDPEADPA